MKIASIIIPIVLFASPAFGQTIYKCPSTTPGAPPVIQQMPCSPTGGGEAVNVKPIPTGTGSGLSEQGIQYLQERDKYRVEEAKANKAENDRQDALAAEHRKARAAEEQAAAQRETAAAIWATGQRY
ncbi:MAG TPA: hypothetical protein P5260_02720 [Candidatus Competibacter sp.]|jgi:hypothetical protein|nr:hypothetical protein [Candidatus Competibacter sp.]HRX60116.1 hypothetical protein [Candidatus Competibacter sp.]